MAKEPHSDALIANKYSRGNKRYSATLIGGTSVSQCSSVQYRRARASMWRNTIWSDTRWLSTKIRRSSNAQSVRWERIVKSVSEDIWQEYIITNLESIAKETSKRFALISYKLSAQLQRNYFACERKHSNSGMEKWKRNSFGPVKCLIHSELLWTF